MRKIFVGYGVVVMLFFGGYAAHAQDIVQEDVVGGRCRVNFYEDKNRDWPDYTNIYMNDQKVTALGKGTYTYLDVMPGFYEIAFTKNEYSKRSIKTGNINIYLEEGKEYYFKVYISDESGELREYVPDFMTGDVASEDVTRLKYKEYNKKKRPLPSDNKVLEDLFEGVDKEDIYSKTADGIYKNKDFDFNKIEKISVFPMIDVRKEKKYPLSQYFLWFKGSQKVWDEKATHLLKQIDYEIRSKGYLAEIVLDSDDKNIQRMEESGDYSVSSLSGIGNEKTPFMLLTFVEWLDSRARSYFGIKLMFALIDRKSKTLLWLARGGIASKDMWSPSSDGIVDGIVADLIISSDSGIMAIEKGLRSFPLFDSKLKEKKDLFEKVCVEYTIDYEENTFHLSEKDFEKRKEKFTNKLEKMGISMCKDRSEANYVYEFVFEKVKSAGFVWCADGASVSIIDPKSSRTIFFAKYKSDDQTINNCEEATLSELEKLMGSLWGGSDY